MARAGDATLASTDNATDFHVDPTPTPGVANDELAPAVLSLSVDESVVGVSREFDITVIDVADAAGTDEEIGVDVAGVPVRADRTDDDCRVLSLIDGGMGGAVLRCTVPATSTPTRGDVVVRSANVVALPDAQLRNGFAIVGEAADEGQRCRLVTNALSTTPGQAAALSMDVSWPMQNDESQQGGLVAPTLRVAFGVGAPGVQPQRQNGFVYLEGTRTGAAYEPTQRFQAMLMTPTVTSATELRIVARVSADDGLHYTYCDVDEATGFEPQQMLPWWIYP
jgi:hypothetical protein